MRPNAISVLAALLAAGSLELVAAQEAPEAHVQRPRSYLPRVIKRTYHDNAARDADVDPASLFNGALDDIIPTKASSESEITSTPESSMAVQPHTGQEVVVVTISVDPKNPEITHRITGTTTIGGDPTATTTTTTQKTEGSSTENTTQKNSEAASADAGSTSKEGSIVDSSVKVSTAPASTSPASTSTSTSSDNLLDLGLGLGGILGGDSTTSSPSSTTPTVTSTPDSAKVSTPTSAASATSVASVLSTSSAAFPTSATPSSDGLLDDVGSGLSGLFSDSKTNSSSATPTASSSASKISSPSTTTTSSAPNLSDLLGLGDKSSSGNSTSATLSSDIHSLPTIPVSVPASVTSSLTPTPTSTSTASSTSDPFLGGVLSSADSLFDGPTSSGTGSTALIPTATMPNGSSLPAKSTGIIPTLSQGTNTGVIPTPTNSIGSISVPHSPGSESTSTTGSGSGSVSVSVPGSGTASAPLSDSTPTASIPVNNTHETKVPTPTSRPASIPLPVSTSKSTSTSTSEVSTVKTTVEPQPTPTEPPTLSDDNNWMPSTILIMPTVTATESSTSGETEKPKPTSLPGSITPSKDTTKAPSDSILLQLGFNNQLPWSFVATTALSSSQIFNYTPQAIQNAMPTLSAEESPVMFALEPYYNWQATGYNATLAIFYFPRDKVDALRALKVNPNSALYNQASESIQSLMTMVDPTIPLEFSGNYPSGDGGSTGGHSDGSSDESSDNGNSDNSDGSASSSKAKASSVGIGVGVVAGAAAYGAGMFWVARRYRKRKQLHQRSSSTVEQMSQGGSAAGSMFAAGGRAPSQGSRGTARSQMISAPVMAENSLGWN